MVQCNRNYSFCDRALKRLENSVVAGYTCLLKITMECHCKTSKYSESLQQLGEEKVLSNLQCWVTQLALAAIAQWPFVFAAGMSLVLVSPLDLTFSMFASVCLSLFSFLLSLLSIFFHSWQRSPSDRQGLMCPLTTTQQQY